MGYGTKFHDSCSFQTTSTNNHVIERMWVKLIEESHQACQETDMDCRVTEVGMNRMIISWNNHLISRRGVLRGTRF